MFAEMPLDNLNGQHFRGPRRHPGLSLPPSSSPKETT
jgi:hypothetical protein